jgi:hypothetical protein
VVLNITRGMGCFGYGTVRAIPETSRGDSSFDLRRWKPSTCVVVIMSKSIGRIPFWLKISLLAHLHTHTNCSS